MTPAAARAMLDRQLAAHGQDITLRRYTGPANASFSTWVDATIRAKITPASQQEIVQGISATSSRVIASPTDVGAAVVTVNRDVLIIGGASRKITYWALVGIGDQVVRIEGRIG